MFDLTGRVALVTGAGQGVGAGIAAALARQGAMLAVNDYFPERAENSAAVLRQAGARAIAVPFDATDYEAVVAGVELVAEQFGAPDILVACVGTLPNGQGLARFVDTAPTDWTPFVDNNFYATANCMHAVAPVMKKSGWGRLVAITSDAGRVGHKGSSIYGAAKAATDGLMRTLAKELGRSGITANSIALGLIDTVSDDFAKGAERHYGVGRIGTPEDVAAACVYLASEEAGWMSGHCLVLNGASHGG